MITIGASLLNILLVVLAGGPSLAPEAATPAAPAPVIAQEQGQDEGGVRFYNATRETQFVLVTFGGEQCGEMKDRAQLELAPREEASADSGSSRVCWCASPVGKIGDCTSWSKSKPGKRVTIR